MNNSYKYTALDLLEKVIEFTNMTPDPEEWTFEYQKNNDPRFVRLQQILSLSWAFISDSVYSKGIREIIEKIYSGEYIQSRQIENYRKLYEYMDKTIFKSNFEIAPKRIMDLHDLQNNYRNLLNYYLKLKKVLNHNKGIMEISYPFYFPYLVTESISKSIIPKSRKISATLSIFIDPLKRKFTEAELIKNFDYPTDDLFEIDLDWK